MARKPAGTSYKIKETPEGVKANRVVQACLGETRAQINIMDLSKLSQAALDAHRDGRDMTEAVMSIIAQLRHI